MSERLEWLADRCDGMDDCIHGDVLLVGEGDFSFSVSLLSQYPPEALEHVTTTSFESVDSITKHQAARKCIEQLEQHGLTVLFQVDATRLHKNPFLNTTRFDRIVFNFPHVGGKSNVKKNRRLLEDFFTSASDVLRENGKILVTLCKGQGGSPADRPMREWHDSWQVVSMAANAGFILRRAVPFKTGTFEQYNSTGFRSQDKGFHTENAVTHVFEKAEVVMVPERSQLQHYLSSKVNSKLHDDPRHPVCKVRGALEKAFQSSDVVGVGSPVLEGRITSSVISLLMSSDTSPLTSSVATSETSPLTSSVTSPLTSAVNSSVALLTSPVTSSLTSSVTSPVTSSVALPVTSSVTSPLKSSLTSPLSSSVTSLTSSVTSPLKSSLTSPVTSSVTSPLTSSVTSRLTSSVRGMDMLHLSPPGTAANTNNRAFSSPDSVIAQCYQTDVTNPLSGFIWCDTSNKRNTPLADQGNHSQSATRLVVQSGDTNVHEDGDDTETNEYGEEMVSNTTCQNMDSTRQAHLRTSMLEHLNSLVAQGQRSKKVVIATGDVYKRCTVQTDMQPWSIEMICVLPEQLNVETDKTHLAESIDHSFDLEFNSVNQICSHISELLNFDGTIKLERVTKVNNSDNVCPLATINCCVPPSDGRPSGSVSVGTVMVYSVQGRAIVLLFDLVRLCLCLYKIPHASLLWSTDDRITEQFKGQARTMYRTVSLYPMEFSFDMSFWENHETKFDVLLYSDIIRSVAGDVVLSVTLLDTYTDTQTDRTSRCYRLVFRSYDKVLSYTTSWKLQSIIRLEVARIMCVELR